jgi:dienelactone hydrolase
MDIVSEVSEKGVTERRFDLKVENEVVPGIIWQPVEEGPRTTILIGHGGTQHKRVPNVLGLARRFVRHLGFNVVAIDAWGHGERITDPEAAETARKNLERRIAAGAGGGGDGGRGGILDMSPEQAREWVERTTRTVGDWKAVVDDLEQNPAVSNGRFGYWGVSMGTAIGLPFVASEPRVSAAVLGLAGLGNRPGGDRFEQAARSLTIPVLFVFQWDDELMTRESGLALFDAIGSTDKTMHINPGGHVGVPRFERRAAEDFYVRTLGPVQDALAA